MTIVAWDGCGTLAADSVSSNGQVRSFVALPKIFAIDERRIAGCVGRSADVEAFRRWMHRLWVEGDAEAEVPQLLAPDAFRALVCAADACDPGKTPEVHLFEGDALAFPIRVPEHEPIAIGNGAEFALGAMLAMHEFEGQLRGPLSVVAVDLCARRIEGCGGNAASLSWDDGWRRQWTLT